MSTTTTPMAIRLGKVVTYHKKLSPIKSYDPLITCLTRSRDKLKPLYLHYHNVYSHQTWQDGDLL